MGGEQWSQALASVLYGTCRGLILIPAIAIARSLLRSLLTSPLIWVVQRFLKPGSALRHELPDVSSWSGILANIQWYSSELSVMIPSMLLLSLEPFVRVQDYVDSYAEPDPKARKATIVFQAVASLYVLQHIGHRGRVITMHMLHFTMRLNIPLAPWGILRVVLAMNGTRLMRPGSGEEIIALYQFGRVVQQSFALAVNLLAGSMSRARHAARCRVEEARCPEDTTTPVPRHPIADGAEEI